MTPPVDAKPVRLLAPGRPAVAVKPGGVALPGAVAAKKAAVPGAELKTDKATVNSGPTVAETQQTLDNINGFFSDQRMTRGELSLDENQQKELCRRLAAHNEITLRDINEVVFKTTYIGPFPLGRAMTESAWDSFTGGNEVKSLKDLEHYCNEFKRTAPHENIDFLTLAYAPKVIRLNSSASTLLTRIHQQETKREISVSKLVIETAYGKDDTSWQGYLEGTSDGRLTLKKGKTWATIKNEIGKLSKEKQSVLYPELQQLCPYTRMIEAHYEDAKRVYQEVSGRSIQKENIKDPNPDQDDFTTLLEHIDDLKDDDMVAEFDRAFTATLFNGLYTRERNGDTSIFRFMNTDFKGLDDPIVSQRFAEKVLLPYATDNKPVDPAAIKKIKHEAELVGKLQNRLHWSDKELATKLENATIDPGRFEIVLGLVEQKAKDEVILKALKEAITSEPLKKT